MLRSSELLWDWEKRLIFTKFKTLGSRYRYFTTWTVHLEYVSGGTLETCIKDLGKMGIDLVKMYKP